MEVYTDELSDGVATIAAVGFYLNGKYYHAHGSAWKIRGDKPDPELGYLLAYSRAIETIVTNMKKDAAARVKLNDKKAGLAKKKKKKKNK